MIGKFRLGIYGGTFSPPHNGHLHAAEEFLRALNLDRLIIMPANIPPHKRSEDSDDPHTRFEMCRLAFEKMERTEVSTYEIDKSGVSYTSDTLEHFASDDTELFLLCGADMFLTLDQWCRPETIFSLARVVGIRRSDMEVRELEKKAEEYSRRFGARATVITSEPYPVSSTYIREKLRNGLDCSKFLPQSVAEFIEKNKLYV